MKLKILKNYFFISLLFCFAFFSCKKRGCTDPGAINFNADASKDDGTCEYGSNCLYETLKKSFTELDLSNTNNCDLFVKNVNEDYQSGSTPGTPIYGGLTIDLNCDGINDLRIDGESTQEWTGFLDTSYSTLSAELRISTLHSNVFILLDSVVDSTFNYTGIDTNNLDILNLNLTSSNQDSGFVFSSSEVNSYVSNMDSTELLMADDPRWTYIHPFSPHSIVRSHYNHTSYYSIENNGNGYYYAETVRNEYDRGIIPNHKISWIPIKFITNENYVKLGYIKVAPRLGAGYLNFELVSWAIQR